MPVYFRDKKIAGAVIIDSELNLNSTNAIQNKAVAQALAGKQNSLNLSVVNGMICITYEEV